MNNNTTYKDSPLGKIPSDWEVKKCHEVADVRDGTHESPQYHEKGIKFITSKNIKDGELNFSDVNYITQEDAENFNKRSKVEKGDILMSMIGTIGNSVLIDYEPDFCIKNVGLIKSKSIDRYFFIQFFHSPTFQNYLVRNLDGGIQKFISLGGLRELKLPLPPLPEQTRIAKVLSAWDRAISNVQATIEQVELRNKWLMQELLTGKRRLKGFGGEWKEVRMKDVFDRIDKVNDGDDKHSVMTISAKRGLISQEDKFDRVIAGDSLKKYTLLSKNDFAYNKGNSKTYQMGCIYQLEDIESALVPFVYICFSPTEKVYSAFYKHWFLAHGLDRQLNRIITSGARGDGLLNVNSDDFFKLKIPYPTLEEQTAIAQVLQVAAKEVQMLQNKLDKLKEQKKGLMQVLLTGKKRLVV